MNTDARLEVTSHASARALSSTNTVAAGLPAFVYVKRAGKRRVFGMGLY
jgi:hypothetical protein